MRGYILQAAISVAITLVHAKILDFPLPTKTIRSPNLAAVTGGVHDLPQRRQNHQVPFQVCPEVLGQPVKKCSDCGGDNGQGICKDILLSGEQQGCLDGGCGFYCRCTSGNGSPSQSPDPQKTQVVTSVVNGQTVTGVFVATSLSEWKDLRSHTTVTTSVNSQETEAAIAIFAGGVAWWLMSQSSVAAVLNPPLESPEGSKEDDQQCSPEPKCDDADCGGKSAIGLCKAGSKVNCPCEEEDKKCPAEPPKCSATDCAGNDNKCTGEKLKDCQCCPDEPPQCSATDCSGKDGKCQGEKLKGCSCGSRDTGPAPLPQIVRIGESQASIDQAALEIFQDIFGGDENLLFNGQSRGNPSSSPKCADKTANSLLSRYNTGSEGLDPRTLQYRIREVLCNDKCEIPQGIPSASAVAAQDGDGCEIAIALAGNIEAYAYRGTHSQGQQWQDCWDSLANITETCINNGPNTGWVNGPDDYEFFQAGFRPLNGEGNKHGSKPLDGSNALGLYCDSNKPKCDTCMGGGNGNVCSQGPNQGCECEPVTGTQPAPPKVTNCATAVAAAEIVCCGWSKDTWKTCSNFMEGCGVIPNLEAICQSPISPDSTYSVCGQFNVDDPLIRGSAMEDKALCLNDKFDLKAEWRYRD